MLLKLYFWVKQYKYKFDNESRVVLPSYLLEQVKIVHEACFVGKSLVFEIWNPVYFDKYIASAREIAKGNKLILKNF